MFIRMKFPEIEQYIKHLENAIFNIDENYELVVDYLSEISEIDEELSNELGDSMTYRKMSPFGRHYDAIRQKSDSFARNLQSRKQRAPLEENSRYYSPNLPDYLATSICQYVLHGCKFFTKN
ncbi:hypothetical protein LOD99_12160 [Oopsacas minuta]|uniref:Uncharacterized protein n=1 Tax=Oopsacas minuta TaxID=111878 RepID=A0AAV7JHY4_9METZ|nr:hypothetical protein LOD99_12160 [Oopsacas minuta]